MSTIPEHIEALRLLRKDAKDAQDAPIGNHAQQLYQSQCYLFVHVHLDEIAQAIASLNNCWQDMATFPSDRDDLVWLCKGDSVDGPRAPQIDDPDIYEWWCFAESPPLPTTYSHE